ncbi:hypothetical protein ACWC24_30670 [Streptomyces sp. NPDC001443]
MSSGDTVDREIVGAACLILSGVGARAAVILPTAGIGLSRAGPAGHAAGPARDLGRCTMHTFLPIPDKGTSDRAYARVPIAGPSAGGVLTGLLRTAAF